MIAFPRRLFVYLLGAILTCLLAAPAQDASAQSSPVRSGTVNPRPLNLDFEEGAVGQVPVGWDSPTRPNYPAELTEGQSKSGKRAALLSSAAGAAGGGNEFGNIMQAIDATPFRGRRVRFRAAVRMERTEPASRAQLWLRVDRGANKMGFFDNMGERPITSGEWQYYEIVGDVEEDAAVLNFGMIMYGRGKAWLDDVSLEDLGKLVFLTDGRAISYAESYMGIIEAYKLAEIVGEPTAGTNGNINPFVLPGSYRVVWTGMKVLKHDGSRHHGVGIQPTTPVSRTIRGVTEKRDEQLERALAIVSQ